MLWLKVKDIWGKLIKLKGNASYPLVMMKKLNNKSEIECKIGLV
jgi:hypothetical protein